MNKIKLFALLLAVFMLISVAAISISAEETFDFLPETKSGKIYGFPVNSTQKTVELVYYNAVVEVLDLNGKAVSKTDKLGTGFTVKLNSISYSAVVMGDVDGDGELSGYDYIAVKRAYLGTLKLNSLQLEAAGVKSGGRLGPINYIMVKRAYFGTYDINRDYRCDPYVPGDEQTGWTSGWV